MTPRMGKDGEKPARKIMQTLAESSYARDRTVADFCLGLSGLLHNARVVTTSGIRTVQKLSAGDRIISRGNGAVTIKRIECLSIVTRAVYIVAGSLGHSRPEADTMLPTAQTVLIRDWRARAWSGQHALIQQAGDLVDGEFIRDLGLQPLTLYRIFCTAPQIIYADGLEMGTADMSAQARKRHLIN